MFKYLLIVFGLVAVSAAQPATVATIGPDGGIVSLLKGSLNDDVVLAVVRENDLYRSTDGGESWTSIPLFVPSSEQSIFTIFDIAFRSQSPDTIYIATTLGLFRSIDKGISWNSLAASPSPRFSIRCAPNNPNILFGSDENGVLRSTDGGITWTALKDNTYFGDRMVRRVAIHPGDKNPLTMRIVATTGFDDTTGIFLTTNGGASWQPLINGLPHGGARKIYAAEIDSTGLGNNSFRVVIGTAEGIYAMQTDLFASAWQAIKSNAVPFRGIITGGTMVYDFFDAATQTHKFNFFVLANGSEYDGSPAPYSAVNGIFKIESRFNTIIPIFPSNPPPVTRVFDKLCDITSLYVPSAANKQKMYAGTSNGIFISYDAGQNWVRKNNGLKKTIVRNLVSHSPNLIVGKNLFAAVYGGGVNRSADDGATWNESNKGLTNPYVTAIAVDRQRNILYAGTAFTLHRSIDAGKTWNTIFLVDSSKIVNPSAFRTWQNDNTVRISPANPDVIMFRSPAYGLNISTDAGVQWSHITEPVGFDSIFVPENIAFDPADPSTIYLSGNGIYKSTNRGTSWINISSGLPTSIIDQSVGHTIPLYCISPTINPNNNKEMFIATVIDRKDRAAYRLFRTTNGGDVWEGLDTALHAFDVEFDRYDEQRIISSGPGGMFTTTNSGTAWKSIFTPTDGTEIYLIDPDEKTAHDYYAGSGNGAIKVSLNDFPHLTVDTLEYDFGEVRMGDESVQTVFLRNINGQRNVIARFSGLTSADAFQYLGSPEYAIPAGGMVSFQIRFSPNRGGSFVSYVHFTTTDEQFDSIRFIFRGRSFTRALFEKFSLDFESVTVGKDSIHQIDLDNQFGSVPITVNYLGSTDTTAFKYLEAKTIIIDTGTVFPLRIRFAPRSSGVKKSIFAFSTSDPKFPAVQIRLTGTGVIRNFVSRRVLIDSGVGFISYNGEPVHQYYKFLARSLERADIAVEFQNAGLPSLFSSMMFVLPNGPPPQEMIDSLQRYIINGGTVIAMGDFGMRNDLPFNTILHDSTWKKFGIKTGIRFNSDLIVDASMQSSLNGGTVIAFPAARNTLTNNVDSVILLTSGSLSIDTTVGNAAPLLIARSPMLYSIQPNDTTYISIPSAIVAAVSRIGKGKIIAVADYDIWWNGVAVDSTMQMGVFSGKNLQFALNVFGAVDNYSARLPEPTPQEAYTLISIPYSFSDSSVLALFKDLGQPNDLLWRMFGKWTDTKGYAEFPEEFKIVRRGEGYWLITKQPTTVDFGTTDIQGSEDDFEIVLHPGYNMIGNPFPYTVSWAESFKEDSTISRYLWLYDKGFDTTTQTMEKFRGYFVKNNSNTFKKVRINSTPVDAISTFLKENGTHQNLAPGEWKIQVIAENGKSFDKLNYIGMLNNSNEGLDGEDIEEPPISPGDFVSLSIRNSNRHFAADYRQIAPSGHFWDFDVTSNHSTLPVLITTKSIGNIPEKFTVYLLDIVKERMYDISVSHSYTFNFDKNEKKRQFRILVGDQQFVETNNNGISLVPLEYELLQNYPNPFNPSTSIHYSIANSGVVKLDVFNMLGQKIKSLVQSHQSIGAYTVQWDGTNDTGIPVASGIYYYRLQARSFTGSKKMTLIK